MILTQIIPKSKQPLTNLMNGIGSEVILQLVYK